MAGTMSYQCDDCRTVWDSQSAASECAILDAAEARDARRPSPRVPRPITRWLDD